MSTTDFTNEPLPESEKKGTPIPPTSNVDKDIPLRTNGDELELEEDPYTGITFGQEIPLLDRPGYAAHIARLDITSPVYQAAFGFWPCDAEDVHYYTTSVQVVKGWRREALYPHFTVTLHYHTKEGRRQDQFAACHIYLDNSMSYTPYDRIEEGSTRTKYFYKIHNGPLYSW
jgi:hypothetical protein